MPAYKRPDKLPETLESLLAQTYEDFAIVIVDDGPSPETSAVVEAYAAHDARISYEPNPVRLGMVGNWRKAFERGRALFPGAEYFAWASDHDVWHPRWLEALVGVMDVEPQAVVAYPRTIRVYPTYRRREPPPLDTSGVLAPRERLRLATNMTAGSCIYGLIRASALERTGVFRPVLMPDRLQLVALSILGTFRFVPEPLWYREVAGGFSFERQRRMLFPARTPWHTYLPVSVQHSGVLLWDLVVRGGATAGRLAGLAYVCLHLWHAGRREWSRLEVPWRPTAHTRASGLPNTR